MFLEGALDSHLLHRLRREERADLRHNRTVHAADHDRVALAQFPIYEEDVNRRPKSFDTLHLQHGALQLPLVRDARGHHRRSELQKHIDEVGNTFAGHGRGGDHRDELFEVRVLIVELRVQTLRLHRGLGPVPPRVELLLNIIRLVLESIPKRHPRSFFPVVQSVNLIQRDDERALPLPQQIKRFKRRLLQPVHDVNNQDCHVAKT